MHPGARAPRRQASAQRRLHTVTGEAPSHCTERAHAQSSKETVPTKIKKPSLKSDLVENTILKNLQTTVKFYSGNNSTIS